MVLKFFKFYIFCTEYLHNAIESLKQRWPTFSQWRNQWKRGQSKKSQSRRNCKRLKPIQKGISENTTNSPTLSDLGEIKKTSDSFYFRTKKHLIMNIRRHKWMNQLNAGSEVEALTKKSIYSWKVFMNLRKIKLHVLIMQPNYNY